MAKDIVRLPLDLLMSSDVDTLETALSCQYALEHESEIFFCEGALELKRMKEDLGEENVIFYTIDDIEYDRIQAVIDLLNLCEDNAVVGHLIDRMVR